MDTTDILIIVLSVLVLVGLILAGIYFINPELLHAKAALTKWLSLDIEVRNPSRQRRKRARHPAPKQPVTSSSDKPRSG